MWFKKAKEPEQEAFILSGNPANLSFKPARAPQTPLDKKNRAKSNKRARSEGRDPFKSSEDNTDKREEREKAFDDMVSKQGDRKTDKEATNDSFTKKLPEVKVAKRSDEIVTKGPVAKNRSDYKTLDNLRGVGAQSFDQSLDL
ncbi:hypothetical protein M3Y97_00037500 [Aphelenchoides bicaudatus]|nr:hypothetical protein M3Y97_00037500 [Aphelenchoides bicaudatus]